MQLSEIMTTQLVTCAPNDTISELARKMHCENIGSCPVVENDRLVGIITDRDITTRAVAKGVDVNCATVGEIMTRNVITGEPLMRLEEACALMSESQIRRLLIVEGDRLVGIVALADLAMDLEEEEMLADTLIGVSLPEMWSESRKSRAGTATISAL